MSSILKKAGRILLAMGTALLLGLSYSPVSAALKLGAEEPPVKLAPGDPALALQSAVIQVAAAVSPAVVNISVEWTEKGMGSFGGPEEFWNFFFNGPYGGGRRPMPEQKRGGLGSGFLISSDGYIMTNAHVIGKAEKVTVTFQDGTQYPAKIVGKDDNTDIGIVKITDGKKAFPKVVLGNSDDVKVGQWAIAIGNPFKLDHTLTTGVISAKGRSVENPESNASQEYIQTDASINPGNSGGPLCNIQGEVIGINAMIYSQSGGSVGIGFAIPINIAKKVGLELVNQGKVTRAGLGAVVQALSPQMAKSFGLESTEGALISGVNPGSAAEKAGLKSGDIILKLNGEKVTSSTDLVSKLYTFEAGQSVELTILRQGAKSEVAVTLQALKEKDLRMGRGPSNGEEGEGAQPKTLPHLGMEFGEQTPEIKQQLPEGAPKGPVITQVEQGSPAEAAGLQPGDIILKAGNTQIFSALQLAAVLKKTDLTKGVRLFVWRNGMTLYTFLQAESGD